MRVRPDGTKSDAFLVHLGGAVGEHATFGRKAKGVKIYAEDAADYVQLLIGRYLRQRGREHTSFGQFVNSLDDQRLAAFARSEGSS